MKLTRRDWLAQTGIGGAAVALLPACGDDGATGMVCEDPDVVLPSGLPEYTHEGALGPEALFAHGVASGDPLPTAVILWTRVSPTTNEDVEVFYEVALDTVFTRRVAAGTFVTRETRDFTVKVDVTGLFPGLTYFYRFRALGRTSIVGRTRTAPEGATRRLRFAVASCSSYAHGWFHAYRHIAARADLDAVLHLGDYIYEYGTNEYGTARAYEPAHEIVTLADYRTRYAQYRRDPDLRAVHQQHPFIAVWDDHESANDAYVDGAENHQPETEGTWAARKAAAAQAYAEWMPYREQEGGRIYRAFAYGDLVDLVMLDTRIAGRSAPIDDVEDDAPSRSLLGPEQEAWLRERLVSSTARYKLIGQQVMFGQLAFGPSHDPFNLDQWDGFPAARTRFLDMIEDEGISNVVILTGDIHSSWAMDVVRDPWSAYDPVTGEGSLMVEFVTPGISSPGVPGEGGAILADIAKQDNPHIKLANFSQRGYVVLDVQRARVQADYFLLDDVTETGGNQSFAGAFAVRDGEPRLVEVPTEAPPREGCELAPT